MQRFSLLSLSFALFVAPVTSAQKIDFNRDIRPILSDKCYACHGPDAGQRKGGDSDNGGLRFDTKAGAFTDLGGYRAIVPGKPAESELVKRIMSDDPDSVMPPKDHPKKLTDAEKKRLQQWVKQGAEWARHWAYIPPVRHAIPTVSHKGWSNNWIDTFVLKQLDDNKLKPSPMAPRHVLLRRLTNDLTGMPQRGDNAKPSCRGA